MYVFSYPVVSLLTPKLALLKGSSSNVRVSSLLPSQAHPSTAVEKKFPGDRDRLARLSLIEGSTYLVIRYSIVVNLEDVLQRASPSRSEWPTSQSSGPEE
jgi:hypothetical protein